MMNDRPGTDGEHPSWVIAGLQVGPSGAGAWRRRDLGGGDVA